MRGAVIHGVLLVVMLVYGYRTWTRDKSVKPDFGSVVLWEKSEADLMSLELKSDTKIVRLERRGQGSDAHWWGLETTIEKKPKPVTPPPPQTPKAGEGSGSAAGSAADPAAGSAAGSAATPPAPAPAPADDEIRTTREFPVGEAAENLIKAYTKARALRDLGTPTAEQAKDYKLADAKTTITVTFKEGARSFLLGGSVYGGSDRYASDTQSKRAYVLSKDLITNFELGDSALHLADPRGFDLSKAESITIEGAGKKKTVARVQISDAEGLKRKSWGDPATKKADQTVANFIDNANNLRPTEYKPELKIADLTQVLKLTYHDARDKQLGTVVLYKHQTAGALPPGTDLDPANPPPAETEYVIVTEHTRVPGVVRKDSAERTEQDITTVFSEHPTSIEPKGNPFGNTPLPPRPPAPAGGSNAAPGAPGAPAAPGAPDGHGEHDGHGHGAPAAPGAPAPAGAAPPAPAAPGAPPKADAPKPPGAAPGAPAKADAPKAPAATPAAPPKADAAKAPGTPAAAPAKADAPKAPAAAPPKADAKAPAAGGW